MYWTWMVWNWLCIQIYQISSALINTWLLLPAGYYPTRYHERCRVPSYDNTTQAAKQPGSIGGIKTDQLNLATRLSTPTPCLQLVNHGPCLNNVYPTCQRWYYKSNGQSKLWNSRHTVISKIWLGKSLLWDLSLRSFFALNKISRSFSPPTHM